MFYYKSYIDSPFKTLLDTPADEIDSLTSQVFAFVESNELTNILNQMLEHVANKNKLTA